MKDLKDTRNKMLKTDDEPNKEVQPPKGNRKGYPEGNPSFKREEEGK